MRRQYDGVGSRTSGIHVERDQPVISPHVMFVVVSLLAKEVYNTLHSFEKGIMRVTDRVEINPKTLMGEPVTWGTRIPFELSPGNERAGIGRLLPAEREHPGDSQVCQPWGFLKRYTDIPAPICFLNRAIAILDAESWDGRNNIYSIREDKRRKSFETVSGTLIYRSLRGSASLEGT